MNKRRPMDRVQACDVCSRGLRTPDGSDEEHAIVLPSDEPEVTLKGNAITVSGQFPVRLVCDDCVARLMGPRVNGKAANPCGVADALREQHGGSFCAWTTPNSLAPMLDEAREYLGSREARSGMDFGTWQKMNDLAGR